MSTSPPTIVTRVSRSRNVMACQVPAPVGHLLALDGFRHAKMPPSKKGKKA
jgi:hypothetical protein